MSIYLIINRKVCEVMNIIRIIRIINIIKKGLGEKDLKNRKNTV